MTKNELDELERQVFDAVDGQVAVDLNRLLVARNQRIAELEAVVNGMADGIPCGATFQKEMPSGDLRQVTVYGITVDNAWRLVYFVFGKLDWQEAFKKVATRDETG